LRISFTLSIKTVEDASRPYKRKAQSEEFD
jgi:hypothetical protein